MLGALLGRQLGPEPSVTAQETAEALAAHVYEVNLFDRDDDIPQVRFIFDRTRIETGQLVTAGRVVHEVVVR